MTYNTGNALGSTDPRDLYDNAENIDKFSNGTAHAYLDRFGASRKSLAGMESQFLAFLAASGYQDLGPYAAGLNITARNQIFLKDGEYYRAAAGLALPYTTTGVWAGELASFVSIGDATLRQDLGNSADPGLGAGKVARALRHINSLAELRGIAAKYDGEHVYLDGATGGGVFRWSAANLSAQVAADPVGALYVAPTAAPSGASGAWVRHWDKHRADPQWIGRDSSTQGVNSTNIPVSLNKNRAGANQDQWVLLLGDSHGWGQGSPEYEKYERAANVSLHSACIHSRGFMQRLADDISQRRGWKPCTYGAWASSYPASVKPGFYGPDAIERSLRDPNQVLPIIPLAGKIVGSLTVLADVGSLTNYKFYTPAGQSGTAPYVALFREKLATGLFGRQLLNLKTEGVAEFSAAGKDVFFQLDVNPSYAASGSGYTSYANAGGGVYAEVTTATSALNVITCADILPSWVAVNNLMHLPGYGLVKISAITAVTGGNKLTLTTTAGAALGGTGAVKCLRDGVRFYHPAYLQRVLFRVPMQAPARAVYIAVRHKVGGGTLNLYFADNLSAGGGRTEPYFSASAACATANDWEWSAPSTSGRVFVAHPDGSLAAATKASVRATGLSIDTSPITAGVAEEVVYRFDIGAAQFGDMLLEVTGVYDVDIRGVVLDNNKAVNLSMGGHSVGAWLGEEASFSAETADHIAQILNHVPVQPSHIIVQLPIVNEYLKQTPIATFKTRLQTLVTRFESHLPGSNNYNAKGVDFLFFTTLRTREIGFSGGASAAITYDAYIQAAREFCADNGHAFVDIEAALFARVRAGQIDYELLYNDSNHPSGYANELIYEEARRATMAVV